MRSYVLHPNMSFEEVSSRNPSNIAVSATNIVPNQISYLVHYNSTSRSDTIIHYCIATLVQAYRPTFRQSRMSPACNNNNSDVTYLASYCL